MTHEILQSRLLKFLWLYEGCIILACFIGGGLISLGQGGSIFAAAPLFLVAVAEMLRIPVSALSTRLGLAGKALSAVVLLAIAVVSFEALALIMETFLDNRTQSVLHAQRVYDKAAASLEQKQIVLSKANASLELAKHKVAALDADIQTKEKAAPTNPGFSGKTCIGKSGRATTCDGDRIARKDFGIAQQSHLATLADIRSQRKQAQKELDAISREIKGVSTVQEKTKADDAKQELADIKTLSPMHKLAASILGVSVSDLTEGQFESVKRWGVVGLAAAFATLSAAVSIVAHQPEHDGKPSKVGKAIRALIARRRKKIIAIREVKVPSGIRTVFRYIPTDEEATKRRLGNYELRGESLKAYEELV